MQLLRSLAGEGVILVAWIKDASTGQKVWFDISNAKDAKDAYNLTREIEKTGHKAVVSDADYNLKDVGRKNGW